MYALGRTFGELTNDDYVLAGFIAFLGVASILAPGAFFGLDTPRWWFAGDRPGPSKAYRVSGHIAGVVLVVGSVLAVLLLSEPDQPNIPGLTQQT